ncbi:hypothetical protein GS506_21815 [Rhodococcus hoagii]|uniref:Uncharacterized protein n=1 Tax=Prescottella equi ATCC 33707 TaxID=525370 RepID=E9SWU9_RHOHA|nr:hypothetical protein HMPREF0724_10599 [Prescottella equi ATCC 33707]NKR47042.1 hypothetical protein [Prescottella equi]
MSSRRSATGSPITLTRMCRIELQQAIHLPDCRAVRTVRAESRRRLDALENQAASCDSDLTLL